MGVLLLFSTQAGWTRRVCARTLAAGTVQDRSSERNSMFPLSWLDGPREEVVPWKISCLTFPPPHRLGERNS